MYGDPQTPQLSQAPQLPEIQQQSQAQDPGSRQSQGVKLEEETGMAAISMSALPEFWSEMPRLWFATFENTILKQKKGDDANFTLVLSKLSREALQQVSDILYKPPSQGKYQAIKDRLLQVYEESSERQFQKLVSELELGSQKPSQLLRRMKELARNCQASEETVHSLWLARLPASVKAVLTVCQNQASDDLAKIADKILENVVSGSVAEVNTAPINVPMNEILTQMNKLALEVAAIRARQDTPGNNRGRSRSRGRGNQRYRSRSNGRDGNSTSRASQNPDWLCWYHFKFGAKAAKCQDPCNWKKQPLN